MAWTSLSLFTVLAEAAVGLLLLYGLFGLTAAARSEAEAYGRLGRTALLTAGLTTGLAMLVSLEHLGWPQFAFRALGGLPASWLSWEVLLTGLFALGALALWWLSRSRPVPVWGLWLLVLVGLAATYASGMIYTLPSLPANAGGLPILLFLATTLLAGVALLLLLLALTGAGKSLAPHWLLPLAFGAIAAILLTGGLTLAYVGAASAGAPEARVQAALYAGSAWHLMRLLVGLLLPAALLLWSVRSTSRSRLVVVLPAVLLVAGELVGRLLFFTSSVFTGINTGL